MQIIINHQVIRNCEVNQEQSKLKAAMGNQKIRICFVIIFSFFLFTNGLFILNAQDESITIRKENVSLGEILQEVRAQSGKNILYNNTKVDVYNNESINLANVSLAEALKECLKGKNLKYSLIDDVIIIEPSVNQESETKADKRLWQTIKGTVIDADTKISLTGATVIILNSNPLKGAIADADGRYRLDDIPIGRYDIEVRFIGYKPFIVREILVVSSKETVLDVGLTESVAGLENVVIRPNSNKDKPTNSMATLSAVQISMEQANRYAGGFDDPGRLVTSVAGAAFANVRSNGIVIRGNAPKGLLWMMEGIQIPNPNHFADIVTLGGGAVTALSSQTMANSDFYTGAFPAEYGNAFSGVFDINLRTGNTEKREHTFQAGLIGIDFASEGPFAKGHQSSYLFNYRYSTLGLLAPILPKEAGIIAYQDLSFKLCFPVKGFGVFSLWGIGALDKQIKDAVRDTMQWDDSNNRKTYEARFSLGAAGLSHKIVIDSNTYIHTTIAPTGNTFDWWQKRYDDNLVLIPKTIFNDNRWKYSLTSFLNHKFSARHINKTGFTVDWLNYNIDNKKADEYGEPLKIIVLQKGSTSLLQFYSQSKLSFGNNLLINAGLHTQYFTLNKHYSFEPRVGIRWKITGNQTLGFAYGLHSQLESIGIYLSEQNTAEGKILPNINLDFAKARHFVLGYDLHVSDNLFFKIESYYQKLFNIPVVPGSYKALINLDDISVFNDSLINSGSGMNIGIDLTLERYLNQGYYYLITASIFSSKYRGGDGILRNSRYNRNYVVNVLGGKEWFAGKTHNNIAGASIRFSYLGGDRYIPVNTYKSIEQKEIAEDISMAYTKRLPDAPILSFSFTYRINKSNHSGIWTLQIINALAHKEFQEYEFNEENGTIDEVKDLIIIPNLSYKIEF
jgi:hypothetical protein